MTFAEKYAHILRDLLYYYEYKVNPRGLTVHEIIDYSFKISPIYPLFKNKIKSSEINYINGELEWYFKAMNDVNFISKYSSFWKKICNDNGTCNSAYGHLIFKEHEGVNQYKWALNSLIKDKNSRQAIMMFNRPQFQYEGNKDFVCTMFLQFFIRDDKLICKTNMRSNDAVYGLANDVVFFTLLQQQLYRHLLKYYPNLKLGIYIHNSGSMHLYENKFDIVKEMLKEKFFPIELKLKFDIIDENGKFLQLYKINI